MEDLSTTISMKIFSDDMHYGPTRDIWVYTSKEKKIKVGKTRKEKERDGKAYRVHCTVEDTASARYWHHPGGAPITG